MRISRTDTMKNKKKFNYFSIYLWLSRFSLFSLSQLFFVSLTLYFSSTCVLSFLFTVFFLSSLLSPLSIWDSFFFYFLRPCLSLPSLLLSSTLFSLFILLAFLFALSISLFSLYNLYFFFTVLFSFLSPFSFSRF